MEDAAIRVFTCHVWLWIVKYNSTACFSFNLKCVGPTWLQNSFFVWMRHGSMRSLSGRSPFCLLSSRREKIKVTVVFPSRFHWNTSKKTKSSHHKTDGECRLTKCAFFFEVAVQMENRSRARTSPSSLRSYSFSTWLFRLEGLYRKLCLWAYFCNQYQLTQLLGGIFSFVVPRRSRAMPSSQQSKWKVRLPKLSAKTFDKLNNDKQNQIN